jgi:hypothetical protein
MGVVRTASRATRFRVPDISFSRARLRSIIVNPHFVYRDFVTLPHEGNAGAIDEHLEFRRRYVQWLAHDARAFVYTLTPFAK